MLPGLLLIVFIAERLGSTSLHVLQPKPALDQSAAALQAAAWASGPSEPAAGDGEAAADKDDVWANASKADQKRLQQVRREGAVPGLVDQPIHDR